MFWKPPGGHSADLPRSNLYIVHAATPRAQLCEVLASRPGATGACCGSAARAATESTHDLLVTGAAAGGRGTRATFGGGAAASFPLQPLKSVILEPPQNLEKDQLHFKMLEISSNGSFVF